MAFIYSVSKEFLVDNSSELMESIKSSFSQLDCNMKWQQQWSNNIHNKLFQIQPSLKEWRPVLRKSRREKVLIS